MRHLLSDVRRHPRSASLFLVYWLVAWGIAALTWAGGLSPLATIMHLLAPVFAGGLVGWWRAPAREGLLIGRGHLAGGPLAASLVTLASLNLLFVIAGIDALRKGEWKWEGLLVWLVFCAVGALISLVFGLIGAVIGGALARATHHQPRG